MKAELSQVQSNKPLHKNPERSYINNDDTLEMFRKAIRNDIHKECIERKNQAQAEVNETETTTSIKSNEELIH